jgi:hypothetical protein
MNAKYLAFRASTAVYKDRGPDDPRRPKRRTRRSWSRPIRALAALAHHTWTRLQPPDRDMGRGALRRPRLVRRYLGTGGRS